MWALPSPFARQLQYIFVCSHSTFIPMGWASERGQETVFQSNENLRFHSFFLNQFCIGANLTPFWLFLREGQGESTILKQPILLWLEYSAGIQEIGIQVTRKMFATPQLCTLTPWLFQGISPSHWQNGTLPQKV